MFIALPASIYSISAQMDAHSSRHIDSTCIGPAYGENRERQQQLGLPIPPKLFFDLVFSPFLFLFSFFALLAPLLVSSFVRYGLGG